MQKKHYNWNKRKTKSLIASRSDAVYKTADQPPARHRSFDHLVSK